MDKVKIQPNKEYTTQEIHDLKLFPWTYHPRTISRFLIKEQFGENMLKAKIEGKGRQRRYFVTGKNIIKFLKVHGKLLMQNTSRPKQKNVKKNNRGKTTRTSRTHN